MSDDDEFDGFSDESSDENQESSNSDHFSATKNELAEDDAKFAALENKQTKDGEKIKALKKRLAAVEDKLAEDDADIAALEKKLGIKQRKTLPKSFYEDGLDKVLGDLAEQEDDEDLLERRKRKAEVDEWLAQKRRKTSQQASDGNGKDVDEDDPVGGRELGNALIANDDSHDDENALHPERKAEGVPVRQRENPYVAPVPAAAAAQKYVPPARRQESGSDAEEASRIRRQAQGFINRLTDSNLIAILGDIEKLYQKHPRKHVTSVLVDLILVQICESTSLPDTLLILHAGFATALYKVIGSDVGSQLIQETVGRFRFYYAEASENASQSPSKETSNLITFLVQTYNFQLIGSTLIFDYVRLLLDHLSELNTELLLRIVRMAGQNLRRDDPLALKDIVALLRAAVKKAGKDSISPRTRAMIDSIDDLKNNKVKVGATASAVVQDHTTRMKKTLGSLNMRRLKATEPLRISLKDMEESDKRGKWWLVGASWAGRDSASGEQANNDGTEEEETKGKGKETAAPLPEEDSEVEVDLHQIATQQNMNTAVRRAIFITIMSSVDYEDAYRRLKKLQLKKSGPKKDVAYVLMRCVGAEEHYNIYYSLVARRMCEDRRIKLAFQENLWNLFRRLRERVFGEDAEEEQNDDDDNEGDGTCYRRLGAVAKMFGFLIANGAQELKVLKCLNLRYLRPKTRDFIEAMLISLFQELKTARVKPTKVFAAVADMTELSRGLQWFLRERLRESDFLVSKKDKKLVRRGCDDAIAALGSHEEPAAGGSG